MHRMCYELAHGNPATRAAVAASIPRGQPVNRDPRSSSQGNRRSASASLPQTSPVSIAQEFAPYNPPAIDTSVGSSSVGKKGPISLFIDQDPSNDIKTGTVDCKHLWKDQAKLTSVDWSWCGKLIALAGDGRVLVHLVANGGVVTAFNVNPRDAQFKVKFTSDSTAIVIGGPKGATVQCARTGKVRYQLRGTEATFGVSTASGGHFATGSGDKIVHLWSNAGQMIRSLGEQHKPDVAVRALSFKPHDNVLAAGADDGSLRLWDLTTGNVIKSLEPHEGGVSAAVHSLDGRAMVSGSSDGHVRVWDVRCFKPSLTFNHVTPVHDVAYSPCARWVMSSGSDSAVTWWDLRTSKVALKLGMHNSPIVGLAHNPTKGELAVAEASGECRVWTYMT